VLAWLVLAACVTQPAVDVAPSAEANSGQPLEFEFPGVGGEGSVSSATTRGRATVLAFVATYDIASQAVLRNVGEVLVGFTPRANAAAVVVEPPRYAELLPAYRDALGLPFPVVMADFATQQGQGAFGSIERVPVLVVLDRLGREVWRGQGAVGAAQIEGALRRASRR
jgi:hypothetical protein